MSSDSHEAQAAQIRELLRTEGAAVAENTRGFNQSRYDAVDGLDDYDALRQEARQIKEDAIERLPALIDELRETVEANGGEVYLADDAADANAYVAEVCADADADRLVKSKSMTSEEIEVNEHLDEQGVDVVETDLGEWVLQLADEAPSHIVAPAIHKSREGIAELFAERFDPDEPPETAEELTSFARQKLLEEIAGADVGMTGANFLTADTGTMALVTSEGNARKTVTVPDTHVAVAGVEKIVPTVEDLQPFVELIGRSGTGQDLTSYLSLLTPPMDSPTVDFDEPETPITEGEDDRSFHLVLIDNGRLSMREDDHLRETLYCIRCSACSNSCGNFQSVGGHAFGGETYSGGIAGGWEAGIEGLDTAAEFVDLCTGCSRCVDACPVEIDIPWINTVVRSRIQQGSEPEGIDTLVDGLTPDAETGGFDRQKRLFGNFETLATLGSAFAPVSNWLSNAGPVRAVLERVAGIDRRRDLPEFRRVTLVDWADRPGDPALAEATTTALAEATSDDSETPAGTSDDRSEATSDESGTHRRAVLYPDLYTNYWLQERGRAAVRVLEALGTDVVVPELPGTGRPPLSQGMIDTATEKARTLAGQLTPYIDAGYDVVVIEPSDLAMFREDYDHLLPAATADRLAADSYELLEYVFGLLENGADADPLASVDGETVAYHSHCQQRTMGLEAHSRAVLERCGYDVTTTEAECCGMAGSFGYKEQFYELSIDVGERVESELTAVEADHVVASGTSCVDQIEDLLPEQPRHPVELIDPEM